MNLFIEKTTLPVNRKISVHDRKRAKQRVESAKQKEVVAGLNIRNIVWRHGSTSNVTVSLSNGHHDIFSLSTHHSWLVTFPVPVTPSLAKGTIHHSLLPIHNLDPLDLSC